ncbi:MAG: hypothetical protein EXR62_16575 [Chloroflexi bacterium]|nr:hypothetical protein [Chloroflexota bacterium]
MSIIRRLKPHPEAKGEAGKLSGVHRGATFSQLYMGSVTRCGEEDKYGQISTRSLALGRDEYAAVWGQFSKFSNRSRARQAR